MSSLDSPRKKPSFFAFTPRTRILKHDISQRKLRDISRKFAQDFFFLSDFSRRNSAKFRRVSPRNFAQILRENSGRQLRNVYRETVMNLNYLNVNYSVIQQMIANSELKISQLIDRSHFFASAFALIYIYISFA